MSDSVAACWTVHCRWDYGLTVCSEAVLAEMGVAVREDSSLVGVFSPKKVSIIRHSTPRDFL